MYRESEDPNFSSIFFQHGYLTYYITYLFENFDVNSKDVYGGKHVSEFCLMPCRRRNFEFVYKKITKLRNPFFIIKYELYIGPKQRI